MSNKIRIRKKQKALYAKTKNHNLRKGLALIQAMIRLSIESRKIHANSMTAYPAAGIIEQKGYERIIDAHVNEVVIPKYEFTSPTFNHMRDALNYAMMMGEFKIRKTGIDRARLI